MSLLTIKSVGETKTASDGRQYFSVQFSQGFGLLPVTRLMWQQFKRDAKTGLPTQEKYWERGTPEEAKAAMAASMQIEGRKVTHRVASYTIPGNDATLNTYSTVVFADENEVKVFANANHNIVDENGEVLGKQKAILATALAQEAIKVTA